MFLAMVALMLFFFFFSALSVHVMFWLMMLRRHTLDLSHLASRICSTSFDFTEDISLICRSLTRLGTYWLNSMGAANAGRAERRPRPMATGNLIVKKRDRMYVEKMYANAKREPQKKGKKTNEI